MQVLQVIVLQGNVGFKGDMLNLPDWHHVFIPGETGSLEVNNGIDG